MAISAPPQLTSVVKPAHEEQQRGLTVRSVVVCLFALLLMGAWIEYDECFLGGGPIAENSPPNSALTVILIVLAISAVLYLLRKSLGLARAEMIFVYAALLVAAPLMTQGMWHRVFGLLVSLPRDQDFKSYEDLPGVLWPHGDNLIVNGRFTVRKESIEPFARVGGGAPLTWEQIEGKDGKPWDSPILSNGADPNAHAALSLTLTRKDGAGKERLTPGESFLFSCDIRAKDFQRTSYYFVKMQADNGPIRNVLLDAAETPKTFTNHGGFARVGICPLTIPPDLHDTLRLQIGLNGPGTLAVQDVELINTKALQSAYTGVKMVRRGHLGDLRDDERDNLVIKPDHMFSLAGLGYLLRGFIPLGQWVKPILAWSMIILALFLGFLGFNVLMRKQWVEHERFTFPMNIFPRQLFGGDVDELSGAVQSIFHNKIMWIAFIITLPLLILKGIHFYYPTVPAPVLSDAYSSPQLSSFFTNPLLKVYFQNASLSIVFCLLAIGLLVETDILFSIWVTFFLFQFFHLFGKAFNFTRFAGYPWEWQQGIGSFIAFAGLAVIAARRHLAQIWLHLWGKIKLDDTHETVSYRTAAGLLALSLALMLAWGVWTHMGPWVSLLFFGWLLVCGFAASKIRAEAGMPMGYWMPYYGMMFVSAVGGFAVFGATGMLVATIASGFMCVSCFLFIAPVQVEMMELGRHFNIRPRDIGVGLLIGLLGGVLIGGFALLCWAYGRGADNLTFSWPYGQGWYFNQYRAAEAAADHAFVSHALITPQNAPLDFIHNLDAKGIGIGVVITCLLAFLRATFMWFPIHPLGYVLATTYFARGQWLMALIAWAIRSLVLRIGGAYSIRKGLVPFSTGMLLACMVSIILFDIIGMYLRAHGMEHVYCDMP